MLSRAVLSSALRTLTTRLMWSTAPPLWLAASPGPATVIRARLALEPHHRFRLDQKTGINVPDRQFMTDVLFDIHQVEGVGLAGKADGITGFTGARRAADTVYIVFAIIRQIEIKHVTDTGDMQAARGHVGRHQHRQFAFGKVTQQLLALVLWHITREDTSTDAVAFEVTPNPLSGTLGICNDD